MTYARPQEKNDAFDSELYWFAPARHFQDVIVGPKGVLSPVQPSIATGRLRNKETLVYLESKGLLTGVRQLDNDQWTYSLVNS